MPNDPFDVSHLVVDSLDIDHLLTPRTPSLSPQTKDGISFLGRAGLIDPNDRDPHGWRFFEELPGTTSIAGVTDKPNLPDPTPHEEFDFDLPDIGEIARRQAAEARRDPVLWQATGISSIAATSGLVSETIAEALDLDNPESYNANTSFVNNGLGFIRNVGRSFANIGAGIAGLPEALIRDPDGVLLGVLEHMGHQAVTVWKAVIPADTEEERAQRDEAWRQLYQDPLGPVFAGMIAGGIARASARTISRYRAASKAAKLNIQVSAAKAQAEAVRPDLMREQMAMVRRENLPRPNVPTRSLSTSVETPPTGPIVDRARLLEPPGGLARTGEGFTTKDATRSSRIPASEAERGMFGGPGVSETAFPSGLREQRFHQGDVPKRSLGTAPPGNLIDALRTAKVEGTKGASGLPEAPPKYQPFLRSGRFTEIKALDEAKAAPTEVPIIESANPTTTTGGFSFRDNTMVNWVKGYTSRMKRWNDILRTMEGRVEYTGSKRAVKAFQDASRAKNRNLGVMAEDALEIGVGYQRPGRIAGLKRKIKGIAELTMEEFMAVPEVHSFFVRIGTKLKELGVQVRGEGGKLRPFELSDDFLRTGPYRWNEKTLTAIWDDVSGVVQAAEELTVKVPGIGKKKFLTGTIDKIAEHQNWSPTTMKAIESLIDPAKGMFKTPGEAVKFLRDESAAQKYRRQGTEMARLSKVFPEEFRETNPARLTARYINEAAQTLAEVEVFGPSRGILVEMLDDIHRNAPSEYAIMKDLSDVAMGVVDKTKPLSRTAHIAQRAYGKYVYGAKIGLGFAPIIQISQPLISYVPDAGVARSAKGAFRALNPEYRSFLRRQGVVGPSSFRRLIMGTGDEGIARYIPGTRVMDYFNRVLDYTSAATGEVFARDLYAIANRDLAKVRNPILRQRVKWAREKLSERFDIDYKKPLGDAEFVRMTQDYARFTQLHPDATKEPLFFNMPNTRWMATLKRFTYRQALASKKIIYDELKRGNMLPAVRAMTGGLLGGDLMMYGRRKLFDKISGKEGIHPEGDFITDDVVMALLGEEDFPFLPVANRYALVGTFGLWGDMGWIDEDDPTKYGVALSRNLKFSMMPVAASDASRLSRIGDRTLTNIGASILGTEKQQEGMPIEEVGLRLAEDLTTLWGSYGYHVSSRWRSNETELKKNKKKYNDTLREARRAYWNDDSDRAKAIMDEWNNKKHYYPMDLGSREGEKTMTMPQIYDRNRKADFK